MIRLKLRLLWESIFGPKRITEFESQSGPAVTVKFRGGFTRTYDSLTWDDLGPKIIEECYITKISSHE